MILNNLDISADTDVKFNFSSLIDSKPVKEISFNTLAYPQQKNNCIGIAFCSSHRQIK